VKLAEAILAERRHPEHGYRSCLGLFRLAKRYGHERIETACARSRRREARGREGGARERAWPRLLPLTVERT
jgi:hypothetical protein